jgi:hypothetical protein
MHEREIGLGLRMLDTSLATNCERCRQMSEEKMTNDTEPYGGIEESLIEPNDYAGGYEAGKAGENNDDSKSLDWHRGWAASHR